uniref:Uncharacterized protein MANES_09G097500 n=1 Tax=Rhizophora mucronata TaxID=61149 RepID=A0A2P2K187_RHIMU
MQEVLKQPCSEDSYGTLWKSPLGTPNWLVFNESWIMNRPLAIKASITVREPCSSFFPMAQLTTIFVAELKLLGYSILQRPKMLRHGFQGQECIWSCISKPRNTFKRCHHCLHLLMILLVPPVDLI